MILTLVFLVLAVACFAIKELAAHGKLKWSKGDDSFWGEESYYRKYANPLDAPKDNWYYKLFNIGYRERFPLSASLLVFVTDGQHLSSSRFQALPCSLICAYNRLDMGRGDMAGMGDFLYDIL